ncbi:PfkB family carbohydrate kinase [uncultured Pigmentiphaga sp.]|uniref:PfkB family carbohydrate kinase n=1 Tax=uncultured Pigmentiphaga sp. TaxID=340361 RepID=UPI00260EF2B0|nr:PfkB family carbohydrate kinase [uncultured Pigmentiphaga sp.]
MSDASPRIAVLGSFMQACCWRVERLPRRGETLQAAAFSSEPAGKGLSVAVGCHRLGAAVDLILAVGNDAPADSLLLQLQQEGLHQRYVHRLAMPSGHGAGFIDAAGDNQIVVHGGANAALSPREVAGAEPAIAAASLVYAQWEIPPHTVRFTLEMARSRGATTVLNPSPWQSVPPGFLDCADVLVVTLGAQGSLACHRDGTMHLAPPLAVEPVKTIGAGDAFSAGLCLALGRGEPMTAALRMGNVCAALSIARPGILSSLPRREELDAWLKPAA